MSPSYDSHFSFDRDRRWTGDSGGFYDDLKSWLSVRHLAVALLEDGQPHPDGLLAMVGDWDQGAGPLAQLNPSSNPLIAEAIQSETARTGTQLAVALPDLTDPRTRWVALADRTDEPFGADHLTGLRLAVVCWQQLFAREDEAGMGRLLLGSDHRTLTADPRTRLRSLGDPTALGDMVEHLFPIIFQRWPELEAAQPHDMVLEHRGESLWVRFEFDGLLDGPEAKQWLIETRPIDNGWLPALGELGDGRIARAVAYLDDHFAESPNLATVAHAVHISPFHFHRLFSKHVGLSPKQYLQRKQIQIAKWHLRTTHLPVGEIARRTGFSSHGHFTSTFHRLLGMSPTDYREGG